MPCERQRQFSVAQTGGLDEEDVLRERNTPLAVQHKLPCFGCFWLERDNFRPACRKWAKMGDFCGAGRVLYRFGHASVRAWRVLYRFGHVSVRARRVLYRFGHASVRAWRFLSRIAPERGPPGKCVEAKVAGPIAARHCHIWPGGGPAIPAPAPALAPASSFSPGRSA